MAVVVPTLLQKRKRFTKEKHTHNHHETVLSVYSDCRVKWPFIFYDLQSDVVILRQVGRSIRPDATGNCKIRHKLEIYTGYKTKLSTGTAGHNTCTNERHNNMKTSFQNTPRGSKYTAAPNEKWQAKLCPEVKKGLRSSYDVYCKAGYISVNDRTNSFEALFCSLNVYSSPRVYYLLPDNAQRSYSLK